MCLVFHPTIAGGSLSGLATPTIILSFIICYYTLLSVNICYHLLLFVIIRYYYYHIAVVCLVFHPTIAGGSLSGLATPTIISFLEYYWYINRVLLEYYWNVIGLLLVCYWNIVGMLFKCYWNNISMLLECYWNTRYTVLQRFIIMFSNSLS